MDQTHKIVLAVVLPLYVLAEYLLPRIKSVAARSALELVFNAVGTVFPGVRALLGSPPAEVVGNPVPPPRLPSGYSRLEIAMVTVFGGFAALALTAALVGCHSPKGQQIAHDLAACALAPVAEHVSDVVPTVAAILQSGAGSYQQQLDGLAVTMGVDVIVCAVQKVVADLSAVHGEPTPGTIEAVQRGQAWLNKHGVS